MPLGRAKELTHVMMKLAYGPAQRPGQVAGPRRPYAPQLRQQPYAPGAYAGNNAQGGAGGAFKAAIPALMGAALLGGLTHAATGSSGVGGTLGTLLATGGGAMLGSKYGGNALASLGNMLKGGGNGGQGGGALASIGNYLSSFGTGNNGGNGGGGLLSGIGSQVVSGALGATRTQEGRAQLQSLRNDLLGKDFDKKLDTITKLAPKLEAALDKYKQDGGVNINHSVNLKDSLMSLFRSSKKTEAKEA